MVHAFIRVTLSLVFNFVCLSLLLGCCCNHSVDAVLNERRTTNGMCAENSIYSTCTLCEQVIIEWSCQVISNAACCHNVKLCALAALRALPSQQCRAPAELPPHNFRRVIHFHFSRATVIGLGHRLSEHKTTRYARNPLCRPGDAYSQLCASITFLALNINFADRWSETVVVYHFFSTTPLCCCIF